MTEGCDNVHCDLLRKNLDTSDTERADSDVNVQDAH
jgi:hypothetical protein